MLELDASGSVTAFSVFTPEGLTLRSAAGTWTTYAFDPQGNVSTSRRHGASEVAVTHSAYDAYGQEGGEHQTLRVPGRKGGWRRPVFSA